MVVEDLEGGGRPGRKPRKGRYHMEVEGSWQAEVGVRVVRGGGGGEGGGRYREPLLRRRFLLLLVSRSGWNSQTTLKAQQCGSFEFSCHSRGDQISAEGTNINSFSPEGFQTPRVGIVEFSRLNLLTILSS